MRLTSNQLKKLFASYRMKVIQARPIDCGYIVKTNKGKMLVSVWDNFELLRWSNMWRENLCNDGEQQARRFLLNHNRKKYIHYQGRYFAVSAFPKGRTIDPSSEEECRLGGEVFARFHSALDRMDQRPRAKNDVEINEDYFTDGSAVIKKVVKAIERKATPTLTDELIYANLPLLYQRFRRAHQLWEGVQDYTSYFPLSFSRMELDQITLEENGWTFHGAIPPTLSIMHQDTTSLIRDIYEKSEWNLQSVVAFLEGYHTQRKWTEHELIFILAQFAIPWNVWTHFEHYLKTEKLSNEETELLLENIHKQRYWDDLTVFVGRYIDQQKSESA